MLGLKSSCLFIKIQNFNKFQCQQNSLMSTQTSKMKYTVPEVDQIIRNDIAQSVRPRMEASHHLLTDKNDTGDREELTKKIQEDVSATEFKV